MYVAWAHNRSASLSQGDFRFSRDFGGMFENVPDNVFLVKASFWIRDKAFARKAPWKE